jgi:quercetin dioxygenase-like cupin family protein
MRTLLPAVLLIAFAPALPAQDTPPATAPALQWGPAPPVFPAGAKMAVVHGDPGKAEQFTVQLSLPDGYRIPPHFHPTAESVEVKSGTFLFAMGDTFDAGQLQTMRPGGKGTIPANMHHFAQAQGVTVVEVSAMGPFAMTYVNPADDPRQAAPKSPERP